MSLLHKLLAHFGYSTPRQLRLWYLRVFRQTYVVQMLLTRKGNCTQAGCALVCCKGCPWLEHRQDDLFYCKHHELAPIGCKEFPIDKIDLDRMNKAISLGAFGKCGYFWESEKNGKQV